MSNEPLTLDDRRLLNRCAEHARHNLEAQQLREQQDLRDHHSENS